MLAIEGSVRIKEGKKWKERWCQIKSDAEEEKGMLLITLFKLEQKRSVTHSRQVKTIKILNFCGIHSGFVLGREQCVMAVVGSHNLCILSLPTERDLDRWVATTRKQLEKPEQCYDMFLIGTPKAWKVSSAHFVKLYISEAYMTIIALSPVKHVTSWLLSNLHDFGLREGEKFYLQTQTHSDKGGALEEFVFQSSFVKDLFTTMTNKMRSTGSVSAIPAVSTSPHKSNQPLNFYEDLYMSRMYRHSVSSLLSQSRETTPVLKRRDMSMHSPRSVSMISSIPGQQSPLTKRIVKSGDSDYDVPPARYSITPRTKDGIYDVPPRRIPTDNLLYDHPPSPLPINRWVQKRFAVTDKPSFTRSISNDSNNNGNLYDTPPSPRRIPAPRNERHTAEAAPKSNLDYNSTLKYVDLSRFDGVPQTRSRKSSSSVLDRAASNYDTLPTRGSKSILSNKPHKKAESMYDVLPRREPSKNQVLQTQGEARDSNGVYVNSSIFSQEKSNLQNMRRIAKSADNVRLCSLNKVPATASKTSRQASYLSLTSTNSCEIQDDGYVFVSKDATTECTSKPCDAAVRMRKPRSSTGAMQQTKRQQSIDSNCRSSSSSSADNRSSGINMQSEGNIASRGLRTSCSSMGSGSHLSIPSPERRCYSAVKEEHKMYENVKDWTSDTSTSSPDYANINKGCTTPVELNYAELELFKPTEPLEKNASNSSPRRDSSDIEYAVINIVATEAVRKASKQQEEYRRRHAAAAH